MAFSGTGLFPEAIPGIQKREKELSVSYIKGNSQKYFLTTIILRHSQNQSFCLIYMERYEKGKIRPSLKRPQSAPLKENKG